MTKKPERLFIGVFPTGLVYCDREREQHGDYMRLAHLSFATLELTLYNNPKGELLAHILKDAAQMQARQGEEYQISGSGQMTTLGYAIH